MCFAWLCCVCLHSHVFLRVCVFVVFMPVCVMCVWSVPDPPLALLQEFIYYCVFSVLFLIAAIVAAARGSKHSSIGATAVSSHAYSPHTRTHTHTHIHVLPRRNRREFTHTHTHTHTHETETPPLAPSP